jgi:Periplasmic binding protein
MDEMTAQSVGGRLRVGVPLSLSGRFARFGKQARLGLEIWQSFTGSAELVIEDDRSEPDGVETALRRLSQRCDILLGPYSTQLMRRTGDIVAAQDQVVWNHGGSGDDVEAAHPGHVVSVLTPASRYAEPFVRHLAARSADPLHLWIVQGRGSFGRQVTAGAEAVAGSLGMPCTRLGGGEPLPSKIDGPWGLFCAGTFEEDVEVVKMSRAMPSPPHMVCAVAAGVRDFGEEIDDPEGIYGVGQWAPGGCGRKVELGISEGEFLAAWNGRAGRPPDYPAVQAVAAATIATHCAELAGETGREALWQAAAALRTTTLFGAFEIDPETGLQLGHRAALSRWDINGPAAVG